jgi:hypothetical protein
MRKALAIFALWAWVPFCWQPSWAQAPSVGINHPKKKPDGASRSAKTTDPRGKKENPLVVDAPGHQLTPEERKEGEEQAAAKAKAEEQYHRDIDRWTLIWSGITAVATAVLVLVGIGGMILALMTLMGIERQGQLMEVAQGASVGIVGINLIDPKAELNVDDLQPAFERSVFRITMKNTGPSKALAVRLTVNIIIEGIPGLITTP